MPCAITKLCTYLNYGGNCRELFRFYEDHLSRKILMILRKLNTFGRSTTLLQGRMTVLTGAIVSVLMLALGLRPVRSSRR
jgi:uncharacterized glyoxalase superfamily protein PhnB